MNTGYQEHSVDPGLAPYVACYWTRDHVEEFSGAHPVLPDGCIDLLFESGPDALTIVGTMTRTLWVRPCAPTQFVGVRFKPGGAAPVIRDRVDLLTDGSAEADRVFGPAASDLKQALQEGGSPEHRIRLLEQFLLNRLQAGAVFVDSRIVWATARLMGDPTGRIGDLAGHLGLSRQYLRRLFLEHTGMTAKGFARVARLGRGVEALQAGARPAAAALASGYADQAHMSREFKALVGMTPAAYQNRERGSIHTIPAQK